MLTLTPLTTTAPCSAHRSHHPIPTINELHHVVPRAWQATWAPNSPASGPIWDPRTVVLCPTGHRNVHYWLVKLMHAIDDQGASEEAALGQAVTRVRRDAKAAGQTIHTAEFATSQLAILRWQEAGGSLATLTGAHQWGEA